MTPAGSANVRGNHRARVLVQESEFWQSNAGVVVPGHHEQTTLAPFEQTRQALYGRRHGSRLVIVADDVALLDAASVARSAIWPRRAFRI